MSKIPNNAMPEDMKKAQIHNNQGIPLEINVDIHLTLANQLYLMIGTVISQYHIRKK